MHPEWMDGWMDGMDGWDGWIGKQVHVPLG